MSLFHATDRREAHEDRDLEAQYEAELDARHDAEQPFITYGEWLATRKTEPAPPVASGSDAEDIDF